MRLTFESMDWVKQVALPSVQGLIQFEVLAGTKCRERGNSLSLSVSLFALLLELGHLIIFFCPALGLAPSALLVLRPLHSDGCTTGLAFLALQLTEADCGPLRPHIYMSRFLIINLNLSPLSVDREVDIDILKCYWFCFSKHTWLIQQVKFILPWGTP